MQWTTLLCITSFTCVVPFVFTQYAIPLSAYQMPPAAVPVILQAVAVPVARPSTTSTTTTTTTTHRSVALAVPVPLPVPFAINALPAFAPLTACQARARPPGCPPCPPCLCLPFCTPAFFAYCSPCHLKCRCTSGAGDNPTTTPPLTISPPLIIPAPVVPVPQPPPVIMVPLPSSIRLPHAVHKSNFNKFDTSDDESSDDSRVFTSEGSSETDSENLYKKRKIRKKRRQKRIYRRRNGDGPKKSELVRPVLTYVSENGDVKFKAEISNVEAARLIGVRGRQEDKNVAVNNDDDKFKSRMLVVTREDGNLLRKLNRKENTIWTSGVKKRVLQNGGKQYVFSPGINKKITNLSISFQTID